MDLEPSIEKHAEWKTRFRAAMTQHLEMDPSIIAKVNYCELGKWLHGTAKARFGHLRSYSDCVASHEKFHREAARVAEAINAKNYVEAESMLEDGSHFSIASDEVSIAIMKLKTEAGL
jgi:methyl-accepting chemotaxis protein